MNAVARWIWTLLFFVMIPQPLMSGVPALYTCGFIVTFMVPHKSRRMDSCDTSMHTLRVGWLFGMGEGESIAVGTLLQIFSFIIIYRIDNIKDALSVLFKKLFFFLWVLKFILTTTKKFMSYILGICNPLKKFHFGLLLYPFLVFVKDDTGIYWMCEHLTQE